MGVVMVAYLSAQLLTETILPPNPEACIEVQFKGRTYIAMKVERSRLSGKVTLTMPGNREATGPSTPAQLKAHEQALREYDECERAKQKAARQTPAECKESCNRRHASGSVDLIVCHSECTLRGVSGASLFSCFKPSGPEVPTRLLPGRTVELSGYDAIVHDVSCGR